MKLAPVTIGRMLLTTFLACLVAAGVLGVAFVCVPDDVVPREKTLSAAALASLIAAGVFLDLLAFKKGATAAFSQDTLGWTRASHVASDALLLVAGVALGHLMLAHGHGAPRAHAVLHYALTATPLVTLGMWGGTTILSQRSGSD